MAYSKFAVLCLFLAGASALSGANDADGIAARADDRGSYTVSGLGTRKKAVLNAGGNTLDLAIAMLETENMGTDYTYGMWRPVLMWTC